ncbi:hypothetical protein AT268_30595 [Bacillus cereus]|uniref:Uncharacterized protein n=1 Tax=Bacillus cereus TaxID=1396 RepID=A0A9X0SP67_BACCE|nr:MULTISPECIES: hypothetical protein [Bacillus cereus group]KXY50899.1 hypothetical protein AT268_30595 [Bacillus cereus]PEZ75061.1 hypothetical protein CN410_13120 [Bacillus anthracis]PFA29250.1 hypothetical protein CN384_05775 [Bacillus thuringiensis]PGW06743.1 hypothetical protein COD97_27370 [Bacillus cereus]
MLYDSLIGKKFVEVKKKLLNSPDLKRFPFMIAFELMKDGFVCISEKDGMKYTVLNGCLNKQNEFGAWEVSLLSVWQADGLWYIEPKEDLTDEQENKIESLFSSRELIRPHISDESELDTMTLKELKVKLAEMNILFHKGKLMNVTDFVSVKMQKEIIEKLISNIENDKSKWDQIKKTA